MKLLEKFIERFIEVNEEIELTVCMKTTLLLLLITYFIEVVK